MTPRARDLGITIGTGTPGPMNSITDVEGVRVGHRTIVRGADGDPHAVRTGVTTIFPHEGLPWNEWVYAGVEILNGYGELIGINQIREWGVLMSPVVLTSSLQIGKAYDATVRWIADVDPAEAEEVMPVVTECDDSWLSDPLTFPLADDDVAAALDGAAAGPMQEGSCGAGTGMQCFDFKGGIGTASRVLEDAGGFTVGVLVLTNYGDREHLRIDGVPVGRELSDLMPAEHAEGSCVVVVATDAPLLPHQLTRVARRAGMGLAATGSHASNGSGEQLVAFATGNRLDAREPVRQTRAVVDGPLGHPYVLSSLFRATIDATEEAVVNALVAVETSVGREGRTLSAMPVDRVLDALRHAGRLPG